jgi:long-chain acyl-CoA synthetase
MGSGNLAGLLDGPAHTCARSPAILVGDAPYRDWGGLAEAVARRAGALQARFGLRPGDTVALCSANHPAYLEALFSVWHAGGVVVPISARLHAREVGLLLEAAHARLCFVGEAVAGAVAGAAPDGVQVVVLGSGEDAALATADAVAPVPRALDDDAWIFFTSGTTGRPKGARLTHGNLLAMTAAYTADVAPVGPADAFIHVAALSHASGLFSLPFLARGATQVLPPSGHFEAAELLGLTAGHARSTFFVPPTLLRRLCAAPQLAQTDVERIGTILVGAAPVRAEDLRAGLDAFGPRLWNGYGQGESPLTITAMGPAAIAAAAATGDDARLISVGVARWATRVRVAGEDGVPLPAGAIGEVLVDGPTVMAGYLDQPEASAEALAGGWLHTGDLGRFDEDGHLTLVDRAKDVVISGGENVYSREVEDVLISHASVADVAVVGLPDPEWGERVTAFVVVEQGELDTAALDALCLERIARHKRPQEYHVVTELPRNPAGKVLKHELREGVLHGRR